MREVERATGLARTTLTRKISSGDFKVSELEALAALLGLKASALIGMAEDAA